MAALAVYLHRRGLARGSLFVCQSGFPTMVNAWLRSILASACSSGNFSSHSFRSGAATSAAIAGVSDHLIKVPGRWFSILALLAYLRYLRTPPDHLAALACHLCDGRSSLWGWLAFGQDSLPRIPFLQFLEVALERVILGYLVKW